MDRKRLKYYAFDKCPECGKRAIITWIPAGYVVKCEACGYSVSTSLFHPIDLDETQYSVKLVVKSKTSQAELSVISKLTGLNYQQCLGLFKDGGIILRGLAAEINEKVDLLSENNIQIIIEPKWEYFSDPVLKDSKWKILD